MIINTGLRTDIPAFYSQWFYNRIEEGYVLVRNPYRRNHVFKYFLNPNVVDCLAFCTKNPTPMIKDLDKIKNFNQFWFVTINPYGRDVEKNVPVMTKVIKSAKKLPNLYWRYDPIFINDKYSVEFHIKNFEKIASMLEGYTSQCTISFIDLYKKTQKNFPGVREVTMDEQVTIGREFVEIAKKYDIQIYTCVEGTHLQDYGANCSGCMSQNIVEKAIGHDLNIPKRKQRPRQCDCVLGSDIGEYNTCLHDCIYCYANSNRKLVLKNNKLHNPNSPLLIGDVNKKDKIINVKCKSYLDNQKKLI